MKLETVNVIEYADDDLLGISSFDNTPEGNAEAEARFKATLVELGDSLSDEDISSFVEDGYWEQGSYQLFLSHSA
jgi:hypothetical protein